MDGGMIHGGFWGSGGVKRPLLLDLFCKAGGASMGYYRAGFDVVGIDIERQKNYPFGFIQADVMEWLPAAIASGEIELFDVIAASPPCLFDNGLSRGRWKEKRLKHPDLIRPVRALLQKSGRPYVIENVAGARHKYDSHLMLCGTMFDLKSEFGNQLQRHRYFEIFPHILILQPPCQHNKLSTIGVYGGGQHPARRTRANGSAQEQVDDDFGVSQRRIAMGINWMPGSELNQAIPPAYTEFIGRKMRELLSI